MISNDFAYWLSIHGQPSILPNQSIAVANIMDRTPEADLISVLFYGSDDLAIKALKELKKRFDDELNALEEMSQHQALGRARENEYANDWD